MWLTPTLVLCGAVAVSACAPYEYYDAAALANVSAKFGASYTILARPAPTLSLDGQSLEFTVRLRTSCAHVMPQFSISAPESHDLGMIYVAVRSEPACSHLQGAEEQWTGRVVVELPPAADGVPRLLAFPPGSEYELWKIDPVVASEKAEPVALASLRLYVHRAQPKIANPNGPCSTMLTVAPDTAMVELLARATQILGVQVAALRAEEDTSSELHTLMDQASLVAFEAETLPEVEVQQQQDAPRAERNCSDDPAAVEELTGPYIFAQL